MKFNLEPFKVDQTKLLTSIIIKYLWNKNLLLTNETAKDKKSQEYTCYILQFIFLLKH